MIKSNYFIETLVHPVSTLLKDISSSCSLLLYAGYLMDTSWNSIFISTEIPNFLDDHEIENILLQANEYGLFSSRAKGGLTPKDLFKPSEGTFQLNLRYSLA